MRIGGGLKVFGTERRTQVLLAVCLLEETYPRELARMMDAPLISVQRVVDALESEGLIGTRLSGGTRRIRLNPRYFAYEELRQLLGRLAKVRSPLIDAIESLRRSPRKRGKRL